MIRCKSGCTVAVLVIVMSFGVHGLAQAATPGAPIGSTWTVSGYAGLFFPAMSALNQVISTFSQDTKEVARALESQYATDMSISDGVLPVVASAGYSAQLLFRPSAPIGIGVSLEYLPIVRKGVAKILSPERSVTFAVDFSIPAIGVLGVVSFDSADLIDMGRWSFRFSVGVGRYGATVESKKGIELAGIEAFDLRNPVNISAATSAWGTRFAFAASHRFAPGMLLNLRFNWRSLKLEAVPVDFVNVGSAVDLDFSGMCLMAGLEVRF